MRNEERQRVERETSLILMRNTRVDRSGQIGPATGSDRKCRAASADFGRCWPLARCSVPRSFLILNEERRNRPRRAVSTRKDRSGAKT
jgi:hypothetical protein